MALSPMMTQYLLTKENFSDCIVLYRLGDFYEMFFDDAKKASQILGLVLTGRDCGLEEKAPMCGVPFHSVDGYIAKLVEKGLKVAICEQMTTPEESKGIVERAVVKVVTPGTVVEQSMLQENQNNFISAVYIGKDCDSIAWADISTGDFFVASVPKSQNSVEEFLCAIKPKEVLTNVAGAIFNDSLYVKQGLLPSFSTRQEAEFSRKKATDAILKQFDIQDISIFGFGQNDEKSIVCGVLLNYFFETQMKFLSHINKIVIVDNNKVLQLDQNTKRNLELLVSSHDRKRRGSLLWLIDETETPMGARLLSSWLENPLADAQEIVLRQDAVSELFDDFLTRENLRQSLSEIKDLQRLSAKIASGEISPRECNVLQASLKEIPKLKKSLQSCKSSFLKKLGESIDDLTFVEKTLGKAIVENAPAHLRDGDFIKLGFDDRLDETREISKNGKSIISLLEAKEKEATGVKTLKVGFNRIFGYYFEVSNSFRDQLPYRFIRKQTLANAERFFTEELKTTEEQILTAEDRSVKIEKELYIQLKTMLHGFISKFQHTAFCVAQIDCVCSLACVAFANNFSKPQICEHDSLLEIKQGRHPIVESFLSKGSFVANDTFLDTNENRTMVLTGPNMAGKSTYMRQVALIVVLAQIGSFVPALHARVPLVDKIFTRVGANDDLSFNQSTFMVEMVEVANILNNATEKSLVVLDEVGRGTSTFDGLSIAWAVLEFLTNHVKSKVLFATHYHELTELEGVIKGVKNFKICVKEHNDSILFLRKIARGSANKSFGIEVAALAGVDKKVLKRAKEILVKLESVDIVKHQQPETQISMTIKEKQILSQLKEIDVENISPRQAFELLQDFSEKLKGV